DKGSAYGVPHPSGRTDSGQDAAFRSHRLLGHAFGLRRIAAGISHAFRGELLAIVPGVAAVHSDHAGRGAAHLDHLPHTTAGQLSDVPLIPTVPDAERLYFPDPQHADGRAMVHLHQSDAVFPGSGPRHLPEGVGFRHSVAGATCVSSFWRDDPVDQRPAVPQTPGVGPAPRPAATLGYTENTWIPAGISS